MSEDAIMTDKKINRSLIQILRRREKGQTMVEFALLLPVFLMLVLGVVDISRAFFALQSISAASREGARTGILTNSNNAQVNAAVNNYLAAANLPGCNAAGANWGAGFPPGSSTTVTVTCQFTVMIGTIVPGWAGTFNLSQTTTMRHE